MDSSMNVSVLCLEKLILYPYILIRISYILIYISEYISMYIYRS